MSNILDVPYCHDAAFMAEWQKMLGGEMYAAQHPYFHELLQQTRSKVRAFNDLDPNCPSFTDASAPYSAGRERNCTSTSPFTATTAATSW